MATDGPEQGIPPDPAEDPTPVPPEVEDPGSNGVTEAADDTSPETTTPDAAGPDTAPDTATSLPFPREQIASEMRALLELAGPPPHRDLLQDLLMSAARLAWDDTTRLDLKILNSAIKELRRSFRVFAPFRAVRKVVVFGSARTPVGTPLYTLAERTGEELTRAGMMVITGAGGGVMEAANKGAGPSGGFGLAIRLSFEPAPNPFVRRPDRLIQFKYFFTRKLVFIKESDAFILFPGGFGTNDECFELITLLQTGKGDPRPVVLLDLPGGTYWREWLQFVRHELLDGGYVDPADLDLLSPAASPEEALEIIERFYSVYHSSRFVGDRRMLRLQRPLTPAELRRLSREFSDIIAEGTLEPCPIPEDDTADPLMPELYRYWFRFDRRQFSRLKLLIDAINRL